MKARSALVDLVAQECGCSPEHIMLLRHSNGTLKKLIRANATIEEYTVMQPTGTRYDYWNPKLPRADVVAVVVNDQVHQVYRVNGVEAEGTSYSLATPEHRRFDQARGKAERPARRFDMELVPVSFIGAEVFGWKKRELTTVQRFGGGFFREIEVEVEASLGTRDEMLDELAREVECSRQAPPKIRAARLAVAPKFPARRAVRSHEFLRNPDVVAEALIRAEGRCERCKAPAPFVRASNGTPYLEVHHRKPLADGGADTVENAVALCPNCHRYLHHGQQDG